MNARLKILLLAILVPSVVFLLLIISRRVEMQKLARERQEKIDALLSQWRAVSYVPLTEKNSAEQSLRIMIERATNISSLTAAQIGTLRQELLATLAAYSEGDFESFMRFRAPQGVKGAIKWNEKLVSQDRRSLPNAQIFHKMVSFGAPSHPERFTNTSVETDYDVERLTWALADETTMKETGLKPLCTDCWKGFSPQGSWLLISQTNFTAVQLAQGDKTAPIMPERSRIIVENDVKPLCYAGLKLAVHTASPDNAYPVFIVFALVADPQERWVPISFAKGTAGGVKSYIF